MYTPVVGKNSADENTLRKERRRKRPGRNAHIGIHSRNGKNRTLKKMKTSALIFLLDRPAPCKKIRFLWLPQSAIVFSCCVNDSDLVETGGKIEGKNGKGSYNVLRMD
jgi:hypothetical protein